MSDSPSDPETGTRVRLPSEPLTDPLTDRQFDTRTVGPSDPPHSRKALFLERQSYRRRRLVDIARLLPLLGVVLLLVPLLWPGMEGNVAMPMSKAIAYVFSVWALLIIGAALFGAAVTRWGGEQRQSSPEA